MYLWPWTYLKYEIKTQNVRKKEMVKVMISMKKNTFTNKKRFYNNFECLCFMTGIWLTYVLDQSSLIRK